MWKPVTLVLLVSLPIAAGAKKMFDPNRSDRIFFCRACGNVFAPTAAKKEQIQTKLAYGTL
jgi:hypothetical protein